MPRYDFGEGRVIDVGGKPVLRLLAIGFGIFLVVVLLFASIAKVPAGHVGVLTLFGRVTGQVLGEGIHLVNPFKENNVLSVRSQEIKESASVPSSEGLVVALDTSLIFRLQADRAAEVFQRIGPKYVGIIVEPTLRSTIRSVTSSHTANALYSSERDRVAQQMITEMRRELEKRGIEAESVLLRDIQLPQTLKAAIETKQQAEQESLAMSFRLQRERQEADRKRIEAEGIRDFQRTVQQGISEQLLVWKGIEATETLARSPNTKVVVIGSPKTGLPLILGQ
ncbi:MAG TPA: prohibitin family protein [Terriglobales bacterium]|jgi:regulator of protease activity HflC (stomatin/prohibitin superfamily)|nr:prohibitin family protein [Terriglobales bacterium]